MALAVPETSCTRDNFLWTSEKRGGTQLHKLSLPEITAYRHAVCPPAAGHAVWHAECTAACKSTEGCLQMEECCVQSAQLHARAHRRSPADRRWQPQAYSRPLLSALCCQVAPAARGVAVLKGCSREG